MSARAPGRPRSAEADAAIVRATLEVLLAEGFRGLSVEAVRQRAGVGKATIYRRFPDKAALVTAAMEAANSPLEMPDTGSVRDDFRAVWRMAYAEADPLVRVALPRLLGEAASDPEMHAVFRAALVEPRREAGMAILRRAMERGEIRADVDAEIALDLVVGPLLYRFLVEGGMVEDVIAYGDAVMDAALRGLAP